MTEQTTIREGLSLLHDWGPLWSCVALFIVYQILQSWHFKRKRSKYNEVDQKRDKEIDKLRVGRGRILEDINKLKVDHQKEISKAKEKSAEIQISYEKQMADIRVELERRTTFDWMEEKVLPLIHDLNATVHELKAIVEMWAKNGVGK